MPTFASTRSIACAAALLSGFAISFSGFGAASAQEPEEAAREAVDRDLRAEDRREAARNDPNAVAIPFERILSAPGDIELNIAYARQQVAAGDLKEANATLERVLLIDPARHDVRVLYGLVLYRLGLFDRARYELELALESGDLPATLRAEAETYLGRIKYEQRPTRGSLTLTTGVDYESNRNQSPSSGLLSFSPSPLSPPVLLPANPKVDDFAFLFSAQGRITHDLGSQEGHTVHADAAFYHSDKTEVDNLDLDATSLALGGTFYAGNWSFTPRVRAGFYWLDGEDYLRSLGGEFEIAYRWNPKLKTYVVLRGEDEDFRDTTAFQTASSRSGRRLGARAGVAWRLNPTQTVSVEGLYIDKDATVAFESYERYGVHAQHSWLLGRGAFSLLGLWAENSGYDGSDSFIDPAIVRDEWLYRARATVGAPVSFFLPGAPEAVKDINLIVQYEYETVDSNIVNFDYKTHKAAFLISKRIAF